MYRAGFLKNVLTEVLVPQAFENDKMSESLQFIYKCYFLCSPSSNNHWLWEPISPK